MTRYTEKQELAAVRAYRKGAVVEECMRPGISIAAVALAHGLNANMLRKWLIDAQHAGESGRRRQNHPSLNPKRPLPPLSP